MKSDIREKEAKIYHCTRKSIKKIDNDTFNLESNYNNDNNIESLYVNNNLIKTINSLNFKNLKMLRYLILSNNLLTYVSIDVFKYNTKLLEIHMVNNKLKHFNFNLGSLPLLTFVNLSYNQLAYLTEYAFKSFIIGNKSITIQLSISRNKFTCLSEMQWILGISKEINTWVTYDTDCYNNSKCSLRCIFMYHNNECNNTRDNCLKG